MIEEGLPSDQYIKDEYFQRWVYYPDHDLDMYWQEFIRNNPSQHDAIAEAKMFLLIFGNRAEEITDERVNEVIRRIHSSVDSIENAEAISSSAKTIMATQPEQRRTSAGWRHQLAKAFPKWFRGRTG